MSKTKFRIAVAAILAGAALAGVAIAQSGPDPVLADARATGIVGEQADGYVGVVDAARANADIQARVQSLNTRRRAAFTRRAQDNPPATVDEMAIAFACEVYATQLESGWYYEDASGAWRQRGASAPPPPSPTCAR
ncbi:MAG: DUF1318 domain-containing protein [Alphaproteobacteria bacterium]|nr:DUF1318 domain-containing protein [Alphaproteobacteria bacterium]